MPSGFARAVQFYVAERVRYWQIPRSFSAPSWSLVLINNLLLEQIIIMPIARTGTLYLARQVCRFRAISASTDFASNIFELNIQLQLAERVM